MKKERSRSFPVLNLETACELLLRKLQSKPGPVQHLSLLPHLNIRTSCGALEPAAVGRSAR